MKKVIIGLSIALMLSGCSSVKKGVKLKEFTSKEDAVATITQDVEYEYTLENEYTLIKTDSKSKKTMIREYMKLIFDEIQCVINVDYQKETGTIMKVEAQYIVSEDESEEILAMYDKCWDTYFTIAMEYVGEETVNKIDEVIGAYDFKMYKQYTSNENSLSGSFSYTYLYIDEQINGYKFAFDSVYTNTSSSSQTIESLSLNPAIIEDITK